MLTAIHSTVASLLRTRAHLAVEDVDVRFEMPTEDWVNSLIRPTVSFFLFDLSENTEKRDTNPQTRVAGARAERRMPPRRIDLWYMVSVLTADVDDEHELLWRVMATLLRYQQFPDEVLADPLSGLEPPISARLLGRDDGRQLPDLWSALGTKPHPALCYVLTAPMDLALAVESPLVLTRTVRYRRSLVDDVASPDIDIQIGGIVRDPAGNPLVDVTVTPVGSAIGSTTDREGKYMLRGMVAGRLVLSVSRRGIEEALAEFTVPAKSYDIVLGAAGHLTAGERAVRA